MTLRDYLRFLRNNWLTIVVSAVLGLSFAGGYSLLQTPKFASTAQLYVSVPVESTATPNEHIIADRFARESITSFLQIVDSARVLEPVIEDLELQRSTVQLASQISASTPPNTLVLKITVTDAEPALAAELANSIAESLTDLVMNVLQKPLDDAASAMNIETIQNAQPASAPVSPSIPRNMALGAVLGFVVGIGLAMLIHVIRLSRRRPEYEFLEDVRD